MMIVKWMLPDGQTSRIGKHQWSVARLFELARSLPVMEVPLDHLHVWYDYPNVTLREMVMHIKAVQDADLNFPIILDEDGIVMDGRHRIMRALLEGKETIKAVRFNENPYPCKVDTK